MKTYTLVIMMLCVLMTPVFGASTTLSDFSNVRGISISLVNQDPDPAIAGDIIEIRLGIENRGGESLNNLVFELSPDYPFEMVPGEDALQTIGTLKGYQQGEDMQILKYKIRTTRDVSAGNYELKVKYSEEGSSSVIQKIFNIDVKNRESAEVIYIDKTTLIPGRQSEMKFTITNVGSAPLRDLTFFWENEDDIILPVGSDNTKYIKYLDIGASSHLTYQVIADTNGDPGLYKLDLHLSYDNPLTSGVTEISTIAGVYVGGETDFEVAFSESTAGETSFSVANVGSNPAYSVAVIIPRQPGWTVSGSSSSIIGNLNKGDYTVATFALQSAANTVSRTNSETAPVRNPDNRKQRMTNRSSDSVRIQIAYTDTKGERSIIEKQVELNTRSTSGSTESLMMAGARTRIGQNETVLSKYKWHLLFVIVIILALLVRRRYKKRKMADPHFKARDLIKANKK